MIHAHFMVDEWIIEQEKFLKKGKQRESIEKVINDFREIKDINR
jgi:hypothetical protein